MLLTVAKVGFLLRVELWVEDLERSLAAPAEEQDPNIVIVTIQDSTLQQFPYSSPLDRGFLNDLVSYLAAQSPRALGIDILFDQPTEPAKDAALQQTLARLTVPLVVSYVDNPDLVSPERLAFLNGFVPESARGLANLAEDKFDVARYILPGKPGADGRYLKSFPRLMAEKLGVKPSRELVEIAWHGAPTPEDDPFKMYPAELARHLNPAFFRDKIVLIGSNYGLTDRHATPFSSVYEGNRGQLPGIVIHAHAIAQLLEGRGPDTPPEWVNLAVTLIVTLIGAIIGWLERGILLTASADLVVLALFWVGAFALFHQQRILLSVLPASLSLILTSWIVESIGGQRARAQRAFIQSAFSQYVPPTVVRELIQTPERLSLSGERRVLTLIFTDVAGFTTLSEALGAQRLGVLLNQYLDGLCKVLFEYQGTMLKFMGDGTFAIFNAPTDQPDHAERAVRCCLAIDHFAETFRAEQRLAGIEFGVTRIGIHTGEAEVGNFGSFSRKEYGAMGDAVNTSSRLEGANKFFGTRICVSGPTVEASPALQFRPLADVVLKGKTRPIPVYEPVDATPLLSGFVERYRAAYEAAASRDKAALALFEAVERDFPGDSMVRLYLDRLRRGESGTVLVMTEK